MVMVMERSPQTFKTLQEEDIRNHFLVQLNGQYEGQATGETFNASGKTDILIRADGKNIFIAECKFGDGLKSFTRAIEQLCNMEGHKSSSLDFQPRPKPFNGP